MSTRRIAALVVLGFALAVGASPARANDYLIVCSPGWCAGSDGLMAPPGSALARVTGVASAPTGLPAGEAAIVDDGRPLYLSAAHPPITVPSITTYSLSAAGALTIGAPGANQLVLNGGATSSAAATIGVSGSGGLTLPAVSVPSLTLTGSGPVLSIGAANLSYNAGLGALVVGGTYGILQAGQLTASGNLGLYLNAPSNNTILAGSNLPIGIGNVQNGNLLVVTGDGTSSPASCYEYVSGTASGFAKVSSEGPVQCDERMDCSNPTVGAACTISFGLGTDVVPLLLTAANNSANGFEMFGNIAGTAPQIQAVGTDTNISISLVPKGTGSVIIATIPTAAPAAHCSLWDNAGVINISTCP